MNIRKFSTILRNIVLIATVAGLTETLVALNSVRLDPALEKPLIKAEKALEEYKNSPRRNPAEGERLVEYLGFYRSWYQSVTPASTALIDSLSTAALEYVGKLQKIVAENRDLAARKGAPGTMTGSSRLTELGSKFYETIINQLRKENNEA